MTLLLGGPFDNFKVSKTGRLTVFQQQKVYPPTDFEALKKSGKAQSPSIPII